MTQIQEEQTPQNIFLIADSLQETYKQFVRTFQHFQNEKIEKWVNNRMEKKDLLYKDPLIELNFQFQKGKSLHELVREGILHEQIPSLFDISPYQHQSESIERILKRKKNIIVSTGTGSGKSMCYWIPIINTCLEMKEKGLDGIKAIVIFPMNALANSQYNGLVETLKNKTNLKVGRYTGDTAYSTKEGEKDLEKYQDRKRYNCEYVSREEMQNSPPDILITNYVMLDLILTRHNDKKLFPRIHEGYLKYLVLDEIHTYSGNTGADVACLVRRLKEKTKTQGKLRCIGTSATIQDNKKNRKSTQPTSIVEFAEKIFGEDFTNSGLITATIAKSDATYDKIIQLSKDIIIKDEELNEFDGTFTNIIPLAEKLLDRTLGPDETNPDGLGKAFQYHQTILFLQGKLHNTAKSLLELAKLYRKTYRQNFSVEECLKEIKAAFLIGTVVKITRFGETRPLLVPKMHLFFTQGHEISSSLTKNGPIPSIDGDLKCKKTEFLTYPMYFCRNCGYEYYSVIITETHQVFPRNIENEEIGDAFYLTPITKKNDSWGTPEQWFSKKGKIRKSYEEVQPEKTIYCPKCNKIEAACSCQEKIDVWKIPYPFQLCPSCNIFYTKQQGEYSKLFSFNSTGRSSTTDVLASKILSNLSKDQKKMIIFTDNRQDTALQAEHMNEFQRRMSFRQIFLQTLKYITENDLRVTDEDIGKTIFQYMEQKNLLPDFSKKQEDEFSSAPQPTREYEQFLTFLALSDIMQSNYFLDLNLEKLGLLQIKYDGLDLLSTHKILNENGIFSKYTAERCYDYIRGILDVFRWNGAINNHVFNNSVDLYDAWKKKLNENILFDINKSHYNLVGFAFEVPRFEDTKKKRKIYQKKQQVNFKSITGNNTILVNWTKKFFNLTDTKKANKTLEEIIKILVKSKFVEKSWTDRPNFDYYQIKNDKILFNFNNSDVFNQCPKCHHVYTFKNYDKCIWRNCPDIKKQDINASHYYLQLYNQRMDLESKINAKEHSAQLDGSTREMFEIQFQKKTPESLNVLVCTPTMELGIDIGDLSAIMMRNVPPDPSRYAQRAGRAGRKNQPSIISVFCGTGYAKGPHDQYFYNKPELIVSGKIEPPNFLLDNRKLIRRHIRAVIFENFDMKISQKLGDVWDLEDDKSDPQFPLLKKQQYEISEEFMKKKDELIKSIKRIFQKELIKFDYWFDENFIIETIDLFIKDLDNNFDEFREDYGLIMKELDFLHSISKTSGGGNRDNRKYRALLSKVKKISEGKLPYTTFSYLSNYGFIPNYGFPSSSSMLTMYDLDKDNAKDNWRSSVIAVREFAPYNQIYFLGKKYYINKAEIKTMQGKVNVRDMYICPNCEEISLDTTSKKVKTLSNCPICNEPMDNSKFREAIEFPHMSSVSKQKISCDEENRSIKGYDITMNYKTGSNLNSYEIIKDQTFLGNLTYEHNGHIFIVNRGTVKRSKSDASKSKIEPFYFCSACGNWLHETQVENHIDVCERGGSTRNLYKDGYWLFIEGNHDVVQFNIPIFGKIDPSRIISYYTSIKETIIQSILLTFNLDESEIGSLLRPISGQDEFAIVVFETEEGGSGVLKSLFNMEITRFDKFIENMIKILHIESIQPYKETKDACIVSCYNCLLRFRNQHEHSLMDRKIILPYITNLVDSSLKQKDKEEIIDLPDKLLQLKDKCDSILEKMVLDEMYAQKMKLPDEAQKTVFDEDNPVVQADFYYKFRNYELYVFVDGPPHLEESVKKDDVKKRDYLNSHGLVFVELDFKDGKYSDNPSKITQEIKKLKGYLD